MKEYYTPTIDEFCLGFEFEYFKRTYNKDNEYEDSEWVPSKVILSETNKNGTTHLSLEGINLQYYQIGLALGNKTIRAKKLNGADLLSIGFIKNFDGTYIIKTEREKVFHRITFKSNGQIIFDPYAVQEVEFDFFSAPNYFRGTVRNKTELIKLLKQLNIETTN